MPSSWALRVVALGGIVSFTIGPWIEMEAPYSATYSGWDLASTRLPWLWGGALAWCAFLVLSTSTRLSRWRPVLAALSATSASEAILLLTIAPSQPSNVQFIYHFNWGLYSTLALGFAGCGLAVFAGSCHKPPDSTQQTPTADLQPDRSRPVH